MRILVEPSDYVLRNVGDMAMLQTAIGRLRALWSEAQIQVFTRDPEGLRRLCAEAEPISAAGREHWLELDYARRQSLRRLIRRSVRVYLSSRRRAELSAFRRTVADADLLLVAGMGGVTDAFPEYAYDLLRTMQFALNRGTSVVMVGQGIGPLTQPHLVALARAVLPSVTLIALRECVASLPLLLSLGVDSDRIVTTGDDAIEVAHDRRRPQIGSELGINIRVADYSGIGRDFLAPLRQTLAGVAERLAAPLLPVPISSVPGESDHDSIAELTTSPPSSAANGPAIEDVISRINRCRVVVTGSYHAGVFALACGIPAVCLAKSPYYLDKFRGLRGQFGSGCEMVDLREADAMADLERKIEQLWATAGELRSPLLGRAAEQIHRSREAYARVKKGLETRTAASPMLNG